MKRGGNGRRRLLLPVLGRHVAWEFMRTFALTMLAFMSIYLLADFFDRFDSFLQNDASAGAIVRLFLYKMPLITTQVTPLAVLAGGLIGLGLLARQNEFVAMRACGVSIWQVLAPLVALSVLICIATFAWNETAVPASARRWHEVWNQEIKRRTSSSVFTGREFWYHGGAGFYNVNRVVPRHGQLLGLTVYQIGSDFRPTRVIRAESATWNGDSWELKNPRTLEFDSNPSREVTGTPEGFVLPETLEDFRVVSVEAEEYSYRMLRDQIASLQAKGVDASESWVDLHLKVALPIASLVLMLVAVPLAARGTRVTSLPAAVGLGFVIGFSYFIVLAFARALGQTGALPPLVAAWTSNVVFVFIGAYHLLGSD
jgi:lipopolysaccharide export system permease protein